MRIFPIIRWIPTSWLVFAVVLSGHCQESPKIDRISSQVLESYVGRYQAAPDTVVTVRREGDHLTLEVGRGSTMEFYPESGGLFLHKETATKISFLKDRNAAITELILHRGGEHRAPRISDNPGASETQIVTVNGAKHRVLIAGTGPSVVLIGGSSKWNKVRLGIEPGARVISCEPASGSGLPESRVRTVEEQAQELHAILQTIPSASPCLLVGHSFGGAIARIYADMFPKDVAGLVLVDPFHEDFAQWLEVNQPENFKLFGHEFSSKYTADWEGLLLHLRRAQLHPQMPIILLTAGNRQIRKNNTLEEKLTAEAFAEASRALLKVHQNWVRNLARGEHLTVPSTGHEIPTERPESVIEAIKQILKNGLLRRSDPPSTTIRELDDSDC